MAEFLRFLVTGGIAALVNLGCRLALQPVMAFEWAVAVAYLAGMITAFLLARRYVFGASGSGIAGEYLRFAAVNVVGFCLVWLVSVGLARFAFPAIGFAWHAETVAHVIGVLSPALPSFWGHKAFTFRRGRTPALAGQTDAEPGAGAPGSGLAGLGHRLLAPVRLGLLALIACIAATIFLPLAPTMPATGLDAGWMLGMNHAVRSGIAIGTDLIFTFGPYAFIYTNLYSPGLAGLHVLAGAIIAVAFVLALAALSGRTRHPVLSSAIGVLFTLFFAQIGNPDVVYLAIPVLYLFLCCGEVGSRKTDAAALAFLALSMALLTLAKGSLGLASISVLVAGLLAAGSRRRFVRGALPVLAYAFALPAFWALAGQDVAALPAFARNSLDIISGYSDAMFLAGPAWQPALFCAAAAALLAVNRHRFGIALPSLALFLGTGAILFLAFKGGFVRQDAHAMIAAGLLAVLGFAFLLTEPARSGPWVGLAAALAAWGAITSYWMPVTPEASLRRARATIPGGIGMAIDRLRNPGLLDARYQAALARIRQAHPLLRVDGTADIYSHGQSMLLAHGVAWSPRPVIQSYSAYTARLAGLNAAHLLGPRAPDVVLFAIEPIDNRLAAMDDGASWPILLSHYEPRQIADGWVVLHRLPADRVRPLAMTPISTGHADFGQAIPLPPEPVWATLTMRPTLLGRLASLLFRAPMVEIVLRFPDGREARRRLVPGATPAGFLLAPFVASTTDFIGLGAGADHVPPGRRPEAFRLEGGELRRFIGLFWEHRFEVGLQAVALPLHAQARQLLDAPPEPAPADAPPGAMQPGARPEPVQHGAAAAAAAGACALDLVNGRPATPAALRTTGIVAFDGWGFLAGPRPHPADRLALRLTREDGAVFRAPAEPVSRPDVARYFGRAQLAEAGFHVRLDLGGMPGHYAIALELASAQGREVCRLHAEPLRVGRQ